MRSAFLLASVALHGALFGTIWWWGSQPRPRRAQQVAVVRQKPRPKESPKAEEPPPPPPPPPPRVAPPPPPPAAEAPPPPRAPSGHFSTGLTLGNGGPGGGGVALGGLAPTPQAAELAGPPPDEQKDRRPPPPRASAVQACDEPDTKPRPAGTTQVEYSDRARAEGIEGRIQVVIHVGPDGSVTSVEVVNGIEPALDAYVLSVLRGWRFVPATHCGQAVAGVLTWAQRFELGD